MCGRYFVDEALLTEAQLRVFFEQVRQRVQREPEQGSISFEGEIRPGDVAVAVANSKSLTPTGYAMSWGFERPGGTGLIINARSETAAESRMFAESARLRRCILPASWYFEWGPAQEKRKYAFRPIQGGPCLLGGLYLPAQPGAEARPRFVVLTREAAPDLAHIHHRMPVVVPGARLDAWLSHDTGFHEALAYADSAMEYVLG